MLYQEKWMGTKHGNNGKAFYQKIESVLKYFITVLADKIQ